MNRLTRALIGLYPAAWRDRYANEFEALLEDIRPGWTVLADVVKGALVMQWKTRSIRKTVFACGVAGALIAGVVAVRVPDRYLSTATMRLGTQDAFSLSDRAAAGLLIRATQQTLSRKSLQDLINGNNLYPHERSATPMEDVIDRMRRAVQIERLKGSANGFTISFSYPDRFLANRTNRDLVNLMEKESADRLEVLDPASMPQSPISPRRSVVVGMGLFAGLLLGGMVALVSQNWKRGEQRAG